MATAKQQRRWRAKQRAHSRQLNVMARNEVHDALGVLAAAFNLGGKGEAVSFACFVTAGLAERADDDAAAAGLLASLAEAYHEQQAAAS